MTRRALAGVALVLVVAGAGVSALAVWQPWNVGQRPSSSGASSSHPTAKVERITLSANLVLSAQLEYSTPVTLMGSGGILTKLPRAGDVVTAGQTLYEVDGRAVSTFIGDRPLWRSLSAGVTDGTDVREVEQNLSDLGYGAGLTVDETFTSVTDRAIRAWQRDHGRERTGTIDPGDVVIVGSSSIRVNAVSSTLGGPASAAVLTYTDPAVHGRARLTPAQLSQLAPGLAVTVRLPSGTDVAAVVSAVDPGGAATADPSKPTSPSAQIDFGDQSVLQGIGLPAVRVTVGTDHADDALVVPVTALVALVGGGYAVEVRSSAASSTASTLVPVTIGLIADSRVQITGGDLAEGDDVEVAG